MRSAILSAIFVCLALGPVADAGQPDAIRLQFDNSTNGFIATNVQTAIEEAKQTAEGKARMIVFAGNSGNAAALKYLEFFSSLSSDTTPFVLAENVLLKSIAITCTTVTTTTVTVYDDLVPFASLFLTNEKQKYQAGYSYLFHSGDRISVAISAGSCNKPLVAIGLRNEGT